MTNTLADTVTGLAFQAQKHLARMVVETDPAQYIYHQDEAAKMLSLIEEVLKDSVNR